MAKLILEELITLLKLNYIYMIDEDFKVYLIEINTNPCLEISSTILARIIPNMIDNVLKYYL